MPFMRRGVPFERNHIHWAYKPPVPSHIAIVSDGVAYGYVCCLCTAVGLPHFARSVAEHHAGYHRCSVLTINERVYAERVKQPAAKKQWAVIMRETEKLLKDRGLIKKTWWERLFRK